MKEIFIYSIPVFLIAFSLGFLLGYFGRMADEDKANENK